MTFRDKDNGTPLLFVGGECGGGTDTWEAGLRPHLRNPLQCPDKQCLGLAATECCCSLSSHTMTLPLYRNVEVSMYLIKTGCDVNAKNEDGQTASHRAALLNSDQVLQALMARGADFNVQVTVVVLILSISCRPTVFSLSVPHTRYLCSDVW